MKTVKNLFLSFGIILISSILNLLINRYFIINLGPEDLGLIRLLLQLTFYLGLLDLGISTAATVAFYKPLMVNDINKISSLYFTISKFYNKVTILVLIIGLILFPVLCYIVSYNYWYLFLYWLGFVIIQACNFIIMKYTILFLADQKYTLVKGVTGLSIIVEKSLQLISIIIFKSILIFILLGIVGVIIKWFYFHNHYRNYYKFDLKNRNYDKSINKQATQMIFHKLSYMIVYNTDSFILARFLSLSIVGIYSSYLMIINLIITFISIFHSVLDPIIGRIVSKNNDRLNLSLWIIFFRSSFLLSIVVGIIVFYIINPFVLIWLGDNYTLTNTTIFLIVINLWFDIIKWPTEVFKFKYGYFKDIYVPIVEITLNLTLSIYYVQYYGINGVILGTIISNFVVNLILKPFILFQLCFKCGLKVYIYEMIISSCIGLVIIITSYFIINKFGMFFINHHNIFDFIVYTGIIIIISLGWSFLLFIVRPKNRTALKQTYMFIIRN